MKRFWKIVGFLGTGIIITASLSYISNCYDPVFPLAKLRMKLLLQKADSIEAITVGHSYNRALDFRELGLNGYHLWQGGSDMFETYYILRAIVPLLPNLKVVFIPISPLNFKQDNGVRENRGAIRRCYYAITPTLRSWIPINGDIKNLIKGKLSALVRVDHWRGVVISILTHVNKIGKKPTKKPKRVKVDNYGYIGPRINEVVNPLSLIIRFNELQKLIRLEKSFSKSNPKLDQKVYDTLVSIVKYLQERKIRVIFYCTPVTDIYQKLIMREFPEIVELADRYMQQLVFDYGIEYYNFYQDTSFTQFYNYFFNLDHLNAMGAKVFTRKLKNICEKRCAFRSNVQSMKREKFTVKSLDFTQ